MDHQAILDRVRVASPCTARWEDMTGNDRARYCQHCQKHVFNLSALTRAEAETLVREKEGKFCGRFHQRRDGRMLTADCSVGRSVRHRRLAQICAATLGLVALLTTAAVAGAGQRNSPRGPFARKVEAWIYEAKVKLGIIKPVVMGDIAVLLPPQTAYTSTGSTNNPPARLGEIAVLPPPPTHSLR